MEVAFRSPRGGNRRSRALGLCTVALLNVFAIYGAVTIYTSSRPGSTSHVLSLAVGSKSSARKGPMQGGSLATVASFSPNGAQQSHRSTRSSPRSSDDMLASMQKSGIVRSASQSSSSPLSTSLGGGGGGPKGRGGGIMAALAAAAGGIHLARALPVASSALQEKKGEKQKVLILLSDTGGGHRASAKALVDAFEVLAPGKVEAEVVDVWTDHAPKPFNNFVKNYQYLAQRPLQWRLLYSFGRWGPFRRSTNEWTNFKCNKPFKTFIEESDADMIISVHPLCQFIPLRVLRSLRKTSDKQVPFVTVVTDLASAHPTWFHKDVDKCFVATEELAKMARYHGVTEEKISVHGLPIRPAFWSPITGDNKGKPGIRRSLGLDDEALAVLVVGGGDGVGGIAKVAKSIGEQLNADFYSGDKGRNGDVQMIVICGKNEEAKADLKGFTDKMSEFMAASDCIVTKAGPGTITEANIRGLPIMLSSYLPGQERGNVDFVLKGGFGSFSKNPEVIAKTVSGWLQDEESLEKMSDLSSKQGNPKATFQIAQEILDMMPSSPSSSSASLPAAAAVSSSSTKIPQATA